jgi:DNA polymerase-1
MQAPNLQNLPRVGGLRECFVPRSGKVFVSTDYDGAELRSLAQVCLRVVGHSRLADVFQNPKADPHTDLAASILGISVDEAYARKAAGDKEIKAARQRAKAPNFGFPGGMGVNKFVANLRQKILKDFVGSTEETPPELTLTAQDGEALKRAWLQTWPEMARYFAYVNDQIGLSGVGRFQTLPSRRYRGGCGFCDGANTGFQSLTADGAKSACYELVKRMYIFHADTPDLYGSRLVNFIHDETIVEVPEASAAAAADQIERVMIAAMRTHTPDVPALCSPAIMRRWYKGAETIRDANGVLQIWEPNQRS